MVLLNLTVRPTTAYNAPTKIRKISVDTSQRVEDIVSQLKLEKKGTHFYSNGRELPLNSSIASHNIQDGDILESCACPKFSAVLSAVLRDLDAVDRLPEDERTEENIRPLLDGATLDPWPERWSAQSIKTRKITLAFFKKVIQRNDRFQDTQVPPCHDLQALCDFMDTIFSTEGTRSYNSMAHIVKSSARNRNGLPTICWELLSVKLDKLEAIKSQIGPNQDSLEEFVKADFARHNIQSTPRSSNRQGTPVGTAPQARRPRRKLLLEPSPSRNAAVACSACETPADSMCLDQNCPFYQHVCCSACFRANHPMLQRNHERVPLTDQRARKVAREQNRLPYVPEYSSGPYAILATLYEVSQENPATREYSLSESRLKKLAQERCRSNLYDHQARGRNAFSCVESLVDKGLVRKELIPGLEEAKFSLLPQGESMGRCCLQFERALDSMLHTPTMRNERQRALVGTTTKNVRLLIDKREDATYAKRLVERCDDKAISTDYRELPAGDYLFAAIDGQGQETVLPLIVERKSWSDLADSVTGKGQRRLDCVRLDGNGQCAGSCQLCRMKRSGCSKIMFIIEGARCLDRDHENKCSDESRCKYCREIAERHGPNLVHKSLELVLKKLQVEHDCAIHFTRGYNETIDSLLIIRQILSADGGHDAGGAAQTYLQFCANAGSSSSVDGTPLRASRPIARGNVTVVKAEAYAQSMQEGKVLDFLSGVGRKVDAVAVVSCSREVVVVDGDGEESQNRAGTIRQAFGGAVLDVSSDDSQSEDGAVISKVSQEPIEILDDDDDWQQKKKTKSDLHPQKGESPCINLSADSDSEVEVVVALVKNDSDVVVTKGIPALRCGSSRRKRKRTTAPGSTPGPTSLPLILLTGLHEFDKEFFEDVNKVWKAIFHAFPTNGVEDFEAFTTAKLGAIGLFGNETSPVVPRELFLFWCLFVQIKIRARLLITRTNAEMCSIRDAWQQEPRQNWNLSGQSGSPRVASPPPARRALNFEEPTRSTTSNCMICRGAIMAKNRMITPCQHSFHRDCITTWVQSSGKRNCPQCNFQGIGLPKDHTGRKNDGLSRRGQERPPRQPITSSSATSDIKPTSAAIREARLRRFGGGARTTNARSSGDAAKMSSPGVWKCSMCTLENSVASHSCEMCDTTRPTQSAPSASTCTSSQAGTDWSCASCTLQNSAAADICEACYTPNPVVVIATGGSAPVVGVAGGQGSLPASAAVGTTPRTVNSSTKKMTCGACRQQGHNRASATPTNCPAYHNPEEVERRTKRKTEAERKAREKREEAIRFEEQTSNNLQASAIREQDMRRLLEASEQQNATIREMAQAEARRKQQAARRAELRARKMGG